MLAGYIDLQRRADDLARILEGEGRGVEATLVRTLRSEMNAREEKLVRIRNEAG